MRVIIAGGGTGGHLFPGIAIAMEFIAKDPGSRILFVGTGNPFEKTTVGKAGFDHKSITAEGIKGRGFFKTMRSLFKIPKGMFESFKIIKGFNPHIVVGVGGYSAGPVILTAWLLGFKTALHEQNILPGITNRILARFAGRIYVSFEGTKLPAAFGKTLVAGNPLRREILDAAKDAAKDASKTDIVTDSGCQKPFTVLILGGSQGAHSINMAIGEALTHIKTKEKYLFVHQTGASDEKSVAGVYAKYGISCIVKPFFDDMAERYGQADLIICRAGATTVAEVTAMGRGAIFIPFPFAADDHQAKNACALSDAGAAEIITETDLNGKMLAERIEYFAGHAVELHKMASAAKKFSRPDAAEIIVSDCYEIVNGEKKGTEAQRHKGTK
jgi:UDP-N-acetylglucosamine--N-acetylmuramyl-(pentapeptide) pyrophosphoryl-undecaprenol N-acetylglucosamine transferase